MHCARMSKNIKKQQFSYISLQSRSQKEGNFDINILSKTLDLFKATKRSSPCSYKMKLILV